MTKQSIQTRHRQVDPSMTKRDYLRDMIIRIEKTKCHRLGKPAFNIDDIKKLMAVHVIHPDTIMFLFLGNRVVIDLQPLAMNARTKNYILAIFKTIPLVMVSIHLSGLSNDALRAGE